MDGKKGQCEKEVGTEEPLNFHTHAHTPTPPSPPNQQAESLLILKERMKKINPDCLFGLDLFGDQICGKKNYTKVETSTSAKRSIFFSELLEKDIPSEENCATGKIPGPSVLRDMMPSD